MYSLCPPLYNPKDCGLLRHTCCYVQCEDDRRQSTRICPCCELVRTGFFHYCPLMRVPLSSCLSSRSFNCHRLRLPSHRVLSTSANTVPCYTPTSDATHASPSHSVQPSCTPHNPPYSTQSHLHHVPSHERQASQILHKPHPPHTSISCHGLVPFHQVPSSPKGEPGVRVVVVVVVERVVVKMVMIVRTEWSFTKRAKMLT